MFRFKKRSNTTLFIVYYPLFYLFKYDLRRINTQKVLELFGCFIFSLYLCSRKSIFKKG